MVAYDVDFVYLYSIPKIKHREKELKFPKVKHKLLPIITNTCLGLIITEKRVLDFLKRKFS